MAYTVAMDVVKASRGLLSGMAGVSARDMLVAIWRTMQQPSVRQQKSLQISQTEIIANVARNNRRSRNKT